MNLLYHQVVLLVVSATTLVDSNGLYAVLIPQYFHPGWPLNLAVSIYHTSGQKAMVRGLLQGRTSGSTYLTVTEGSIDLDAGQTGLLSMQVPHDMNSASQFMVKVESTHGLEFSHISDIKKNANETVIMVQTDRNMYKPGQNVQYRVLHLNKDLAPVNDDLSVIIQDPKGNKLERFDNVTSANGVTANDYDLPSYAPIGMWEIQIISKNEEVLHTKAFKVDEYVLPKFSVDVRSEPEFLIHGIYNLPPAIIVETKYTYGKAVQGTCTLTLSKEYGSKAIFTKEIPDSGIVEFVDINWASIVGSQPLEKTKLIGKVKVDDVTGRTEYGDVEIDVFRGHYKVEILPGSPEIMHSQIETELYIKISDHYGKPAAGQEARVTVTLPGMLQISSIVTIEEGQAYAIFKFTPVWSNSNVDKQENILKSDISGSVKIQLISDPLITIEKNIFWFSSINGEALKIDIPMNMDIAKGQSQELQIKKTRPGGLIAYSIMSQGIIVEANNVENGRMTLTPTFAMCPRARLVVYQLMASKDGETSSEVIADSIEFSPSLCFDKKVQVGFSAMKQKTGTDANLQVNIVDGSGNNIEQSHDVFYLAVDKSIVLLQGDTMMSEKKAMNALDEMNDWRDNSVAYDTHTIFESLSLEILAGSAVSKVEDNRPRYFDSPVQAMGGGDSNIRRKTSNMDININPTDDSQKESNQQTTKLPNKVRVNFPDTWLWGQGTTTDKGQYKTKVRLPDTITSWYVSAFAMNNEGIAVAAKPVELTAFQPFFLSMNLPYSIVKGEQFALQITVFNYQSEAVVAEISLFLDPTITITGGDEKDGAMKQRIKLPPNRGSAVIFDIQAAVSGPRQAQFHAEVKNTVDSTQKDEVIRKMLIKTFGAVTETVQTQLMLLDHKESITKTFKSQWPSSSVQNIRQEVKVTGEVVGQSLTNLQQLVRVPTGCGEQNMIGMVPNIYGIMYIQETGKTEAEGYIPAMTSNMKTGYQRQVVKYRKSDGSYSAWESDPVGSTWLTAFVVKSFAAASGYIKVDPQVVTSAITFLDSRQDSLGRFKEEGNVIHKELQAGTSEGLPLNVYCLLSLIETQEAMDLGSSMDSTITQMTRSTVTRILDKISMILKSDTTQSANPFLPSLTAYTLSLVKNPLNSVQVAIDALIGHIEDSKVPWRFESDARSTSYAKPTVLMTAAYTLMAYLRHNKMFEATNVMKWLQSQQNSRGGFGSTQDTLLVLQSLTEYGILFKSVKPTGKVTISYQNTTETLDISGGRSILLQVVDLPVDVKAIDVTLIGGPNSVAVVKYLQVSETTELRSQKVVEIGNALGLKTKSRILSPITHEIEACFTSTLDQGVGMYVGTIELESGNVAADTVERMMVNNPSVSQIEIEEDLIHFYIDSIPKSGQCVIANVEMQTNITNLVRGTAKFYSYYDTEYSIETELDEPQFISDGNGSGTSLISFSGLLLSIVVCILTSLLACI